MIDLIHSRDREFITELKSIIEQIVRRWNWLDRDSVDDIAQDCFLKLYRNLEEGRFEGRSSFKTYIYIIVKRTCIDYYRADRTSRTTDLEKVDLADDTLSPDIALIRNEERSTAARVLMSLPRECRRLWRIIFFGKRNYRQAAEMLGLKEGTVKRKMWECRQNARELASSFEK